MPNAHTTSTINQIPIARTAFWRSFEQISDDIQQGFDRHGDIIQLKGVVVRAFCLRDPVLIEQALGHPDVGQTKLPAMFPRLKFMMPKSTVVVAGGEVWRNSRAHIKNFFGQIDDHVSIARELTAGTLRSRLDQYANSGTSFDIYDELLLHLTRLAFRLLLSESPPESIVRSMNEKCHFLETEFSKRLPPILPFSKDVRFREAVRELRGMMSDAYRQRLQSGEHRSDLLGILIAAQEQHTELNEDWVVDHLVEIWNSIRLVAPPVGLGIRLVLQHADVQEKLEHDLRHVESDTDRKGACPWLENVILETLRFYPSQLMVPRWCKNEISISGFKIPRNSLLLSMILHTHRNPNVFVDPDEFSPERWDSERRRNSRFSSLAFGAGPRQCPGRALAEALMRTLISEIFARYTLQQIAGVQDDSTNPELTVHPRSRDWASVTIRPAKRLLRAQAAVGSV